MCMILLVILYLFDFNDIFSRCAFVVIPEPEVITVNEYDGRFIPGELYFVVMFQDELMTVPVVQTLIYERYSQQDGGTRCFLFREIPLHGAESMIFIREDDADHLVLDKPGLLAKLTSCFYP